jgi:hypothetical protein
MVVSAPQTRRGAIGSLMVAVAAGTAPTALADVGRKAVRTSDADFIRQLDGLFNNGGLAARHALAAGFRPEQLATIMANPERPEEPLRWPALLFKTDDGEFHAFRPTGRGHG